MAIDQSQLLQMLLQGGGGGLSISPTSGLQDPSLSGLALGPQGMGFGGGESLMGGGTMGGGFGGAGGGLGGLDISQLLAQLQAAPGVTGAGLTAGIGAGNLGAFGAGGQMGQEPSGSMPTAAQQGQAGLGAAGTAAQFLRLLKEGAGLGKTLTQLFPKGAETSQVSDINSILASMGISGTPFVPTASVVSGASGGSVPSLPFEPSQTLPFQIDPAILSGASGGGLAAGGVPLTGAELSARLGAQGLGDIPSGGAPTGLFEGLGGLQGVLSGAGVLGNLGFGALNLAQGNTGAGLGGLLGTGAGLSLGAALAPETAGLSLLLGGLGGGGGGLLGGLFGDGGPSEAWRSFGPRLAATLPPVIGAGTNLVQKIVQAQSEEEIANAISEAKQQIEGAGVGGFASRAPGRFDFPELPGATGTAHEGGLLFNPNALTSLIFKTIGDKLEILRGQLPADIAAAFPQRVADIAQRVTQGAGGNFEDFNFPDLIRPVPQPLLQQPVTQQIQPQATLPPVTGSSRMQSLGLPGSPEPDILTLLQRMGLT